jgi:hypothetical protein
VLTLFSIPKPFHGHIEIIQQNAIKSWTLMRPRPEIVLFGDEKGTAETARLFGTRHVPQVARNEYGTPLVNDLFDQAQRTAAHNVLCYVNADIILMSDFLQTVSRVIDWRNPVLMVGRRWDMEMAESLDFSTGWENAMRSRLDSSGVLHAATGIDYFVFPRGMWRDIPPFAIGRTTWDNWLIYRARAIRVPVVDVTKALVAVHQDHNYLHVSSKAGDVWKGPEAKQNLELAGGWKHAFTLDDATHLLANGRPRLAISSKHLLRRVRTLPTLYSFPEIPKLLIKPIAWGVRRTDRVRADKFVR